MLFKPGKSLITYIPVLDTTWCDKVCQWLAAGQWFSPGIPVSSTNKTDSHDITEILLKVALNTITSLQYAEHEMNYLVLHNSLKQQSTGRDI